MSFKAQPRLRYITADRLPEYRMVKHENGTTSQKKTNRGNVRSVLAYLTDAADNTTLKVNRTQRRIADDTGIPERSVREALLVLTEFGFIERRHRGSKDLKKRLPDEIHLRIFEDDVWDEWLRTAPVRVPKPAQHAGTKPAQGAAYKEQISTDTQIFETTTETPLRYVSGATWPDADDVPWPTSPGVDLDAEAGDRVTVDTTQSATREGQTGMEDLKAGTATQTTLAVQAEPLTPEILKFNEMKERVRFLSQQLLEPAKPLTVNQRANLMASVYFEAVNGMCNFVAVQQICKTAINSGRYGDRQVIEALWNMGRENRPVTKTSLMVAIDKPFDKPKTSAGTRGLMAAMAWAAESEGAAQ